MDARERWQALQARLTAARVAADAGDRATALAEITAALAIDPDFLAAHSLRERILEPRSAPSPAAPAPSAAVAAPASGMPHAYATFEQRAKRRRLDRRVEAARVAMSQHRLTAAGAALDEVTELDPELPELAELTARFNALRRAADTPHRGPWVAAAAVFVSGLLGASWLQESPSLASRSMIAAAPLLTAVIPAVEVAAQLEAIGTTGERERADAGPIPLVSVTRASELRPALPPPAPRSPEEEATPPRALAAAVPTRTVPESVDPLDRGGRESIAVSAVAAPVDAVDRLVQKRQSTPDPAAPAAIDESALIKHALQRYRSAYEELDARSAQAVWPAVNQAALARAFDGLESQTLTFDVCDVRVYSESATATCHGSARYVPKIGSRDPRVEPRVWNFTLHKAGTDWTIDSARAER